jgi:hypothetical protein
MSSFFTSLQNRCDENVIDLGQLSVIPSKTEFLDLAQLAVHNSLGFGMGQMA